MPLIDAARLTEAQLRRLGKEDRAQLAEAVAAWQRADHRAHQLRYYDVANPAGRLVHETRAREVGLSGGNRSGKSDLLLAEWAIRATGIVPDALAGWYPRGKVRPPIQARLVCASLVTAWDLNLKPKLQPWVWSGGLNADGVVGDPGHGHWGWVPPAMLIQGEWDRSWSEKHRTLTLANGSRLHVMGHEQDAQDYAQGSFPLVLEDELPPESVHRENRMRVMDAGGQVVTAGTPPDDRTAAVTAAWFHDEIMVPGLSGSRADVAAAILWTERNRFLAAADVAWVSANLTAEQRQVRLYGAFLHLTGLVLPGFTTQPKTWCLPCQAVVFPTVESVCPICGRRETVVYSHIWDGRDLEWPGPAEWPALFYMDPHQARPTACAWFKIDPLDRWWQVGELEVAGSAGVVKAAVEQYEAAHRLTPVWRKGDPKITAQTNQFAREFDGQPWNLRRAFEEVGFDFEDANTNFSVARERLVRAMEPDPYTRTPRLRVHESCRQTIYQVSHFVWEASARRENVSTKELPARRHSDFPALWRYLAMDDPTWSGLQRLRHPEPIRIGAGGTGRNPRTGW